MVAVGAGTRNWQVGDRVTVPFVSGCGRCGECQQWGTVTEVAEQTGILRGFTAHAPTADRVARPITDVATIEAPRRPTGVGEFDRVLGGGLVAGATILIANARFADIMGDPAGSIPREQFLLFYKLAPAALPDPPLPRINMIPIDECTITDYP